MPGRWTRTLISTIGTLALIALVSLAAVAQETPKPEGGSQKQTGTTIDTWRNALPGNEQVTTPADTGDPTANTSREESSAQVERRLTALERRWMEAVKLHDADLLRRLLADDFTLTGAPSTGILMDKSQYIENTLRDWKLESYDFDKVTVRVYENTAVVNAVTSSEPASLERNGAVILSSQMCG